MLNRKKSKNLFADHKRKLITKFLPKSPISEQYRTIRTNIQFSSVDKEIKTIMVTSSGPEEGKSTTIANMAVVFAQQGKKVLLVDADLRKPTVHYTFQLSNIYGVTSVLSKQVVLENAVVKTDVEGLEILPSGPIPPNPSELLASDSMKVLLEKARREYDVVLIDTPPALAVTDAQILSNLCDGTILVVCSGKTEVEQAVKAKELLTSAKGKIIGTVLNQKKMKNSQYYYYYGNK